MGLESWVPVFRMFLFHLMVPLYWWRELKQGTSGTCRGYAQLGLAYRNIFLLDGIQGLFPWENGSLLPGKLNEWKCRAVYGRGFISPDLC